MASKGIALVTGASRGLGRAIALRLAGDGFDIAINDVPSAKEYLDSLRKDITDRGRQAFVTIADVSVDRDVEGMVNSVVKNMGGLDVMVANAGVCLTKPVTETTAKEWDHLFSVNVRGVFLCYKYAGLQMIAQGRGGRIIGASSVAGKQGEPLLGAYGASKFAVRGLTQTTARELGKYGITVNAYAPGAIDTDMLKSIGEVAGGVDAFYAGAAGHAAVGYVGSPSDVASVVSYLAKEEARYITGQSVSVNGGRYFD